ncbi:hypothetical protein [Actinomadura sp. 7K507]|uniref:hypothetical protein n=1 Tax=Actinomadura sp. 7K507 TaxID=2530365 RepID=UPI00104DC64D|nr:hypothetical protein [Actinomadura sp. 7K507]TDC75642.1 hypothetical protein E1285_40905 [Actinomadura sp. 7K507]
MSQVRPDQYRRLLRVLAALNIALVRHEPRGRDLPPEEWPYVTQPAMAVRGLLEEALVSVARLVGDPDLACPPLPRHVVLPRVARSASALIAAAARSGSLSDWTCEPTTGDLYGNRGRAHQVLRTGASLYRAEHTRSQRPNLTASQTRLAIAHLDGLGQAIDALVAAAARWSGLQRQAELLAEVRSEPMADMPRPPGLTDLPDDQLRSLQRWDPWRPRHRTG